MTGSPVRKSVRPFVRNNFTEVLRRGSACLSRMETNKTYLLIRDLRKFEVRFEFESDDSDSIRFVSDGLIRNFRIGRTCRHTTNYSHWSTKTSTVAPL